MTDLLLVAAAAWVTASVLALAARRQPFVVAAGWAFAAGGAACTIGGILLALHGRPVAIVAPGGHSMVGSLALRATPLDAPFVALLGVVALAIGTYMPRYHQAATGTAGYLCVFGLAAVASLGVLLAASVTTFLVAWESMTLTTALLVLRHYRRPGVREGTFLYLACGELGFAMVVAAFVILATQAHSLDLATIASKSSSIAGGWRDAAFVLALAGFGFKAGLVPLHIWLPVAHPVAPADGSAFLSGLVIKLGVYGIALFAFALLPREPTWWGVLTMAIGVLSAVLGVLYAVMEKELKRFLAFSSIENVGIVVAALGASMVFAANGQRTLGAFLLLVALYHAVNHGCAKTLLFLEAGVVEHGAGTLDLDRLGGLVHRLRRSTVVVLVGTMAMAALPPLNGFVSEWLVFQGMFQGFRIPSHGIAVLILLAAATLGLTAGIAILAFVRFFGVAFLGIPRSPESARASERGQPVLGPALLAVACVSLAVGAPAVIVALGRVARAVTGVDLRPVVLLPNLTVIPAHTDFSAFSPTYLAVFLLAVTAVPVAIYLAGRPRGETLRVQVWDGGMLQYRPRMQYTATTFANPVRVTFDRLYRPEIHVDRASDDPAGRSGPVHYRIQVTPIFERYLYRPAFRALRAVSRWLEPVQSGDVNLYLLYILVVLVVAFIVYRW